MNRFAFVAFALLFLSSPALAGGGYSDYSESCIQPTVAVESFWERAFMQGLSSDAKECRRQCRILSSGCRKIAKANYRCGVAETSLLVLESIDPKQAKAALKSDKQAALAYCKEAAAECAACAGD